MEVIELETAMEIVKSALRSLEYGNCMEDVIENARCDMEEKKLPMTEFEQQVHAMRHAQRQYFKSREPKFLAEAKKYESEVDKYLMEKLNEQKQPKLF